MGCILPLLICLANGPETVRLDVVRDTWVSAVGKEADGNLGASPRLKAKGIQEMFLVDIDPRPLLGRTIRSAQLHVRLASPDAPLRRTTVSTISSDWIEGSSTNYQPQPGSASFNWAEQGVRPWTTPGSNLTSVILGEGNSRWGFGEATPHDAQGWQTIPVEPDVVAARIAGQSHGFAVIDDVGSEYERQGDRFTYHPFPNRFVYSRDQNASSSPYFTVEFGEEDRTAPPPPAGIQSASGEVAWRKPSADTCGYRAIVIDSSGRSIPIPIRAFRQEGAMARLPADALGLSPDTEGTLRIMAVDFAGNVSAAAQVRVSAPRQEKIELAAPPPGTGRSAVSKTVGIIDALDKIDPDTGESIPPHQPGYPYENHLCSAGAVRLYAARNEFVDFQAVIAAPARSLEAKLAFDDPAIKATVSRFQYVATKRGRLPDPVVPLRGSEIPEGRFVPLLCEVFVPYGTTRGDHMGRLTVTADGKTSTLPVKLHVWGFALPNRLAFLPEMNCYGLPDGPAELEYYRLAQLHRTCLNRLPYNWRGQVGDGLGPTWRNGAFDWSGYDRRFGPLLDGSAFKDLPRGAIPVETFYLPLNENWPIPIEPAFKGGYWADEALPPSYFSAFSSASRAFAEHARERGWTETLMEFYLNNKVYFKDASWSRSSAPWIFDEPVNTQDFWALRCFGKAFHAGVDPVAGPAKLVFRCDISRPEWRRDLLDGLLDVNVVGGAFQKYRASVREHAKRNGEIVINYGSANAIEASNVQPAAWCLDAWTLGVDGVLPWQTIGTAKSWKEGDPLALFYPSSDGPVPSIRLKAFRRGEQDVEYLTLLAGVRSRDAVAAFARKELGLAGVFTSSSPEDAGVTSYESIDPAKLWSLRVRIGQRLESMAPQRLGIPAPPRRNVQTLPEHHVLRQ